MKIKKGFLVRNLISTKYMGLKNNGRCLQQPPNEKEGSVHTGSSKPETAVILTRCRPNHLLEKCSKLV